VRTEEKIKEFGAIMKVANRMQLYRLIYFSWSALHVSGDVFAHHQEHLTVFTVSGSFFYLLIKHVPLPWVILHAVGIQLGSITGDTVASITQCRQSLYSLYGFTALVIA
jgi:hypothetical protein